MKIVGQMSMTLNITEKSHRKCSWILWIECNSQNFLYEDFIIVKHTVHSQQEYQHTIAAVNAVEVKIKYNDMGPR